MSKYGVEWDILIEIAKGDYETVVTIAESNSINWGELIEQAINHKMLPLVCFVFINNEKLFKLIPAFINQQLKIAYDVNMLKTMLIKKEVEKIDKALCNNNVPYVATKGVVLDSLLYESKGYRFLSDADFMILPQFKQRVLSILQEEGYVAGTVDWKTNEIRKMTREEYLQYLLANEKIPEHVTKIDNSIIKYVSVGFVTSFTWEACEYAVDMQSAFQSCCRIKMDEDHGEVNCLDIAHHFIYIILHLYKHAWVEFLAKWNNDVNLAKFMDVYRYWVRYKEILLVELPFLMKQYNIERPILWTLYHTDNVFGSNIVSEFGMENSPKINGKYLNSANDMKGNIRYWKGNMTDRLVSKNRSELFSSEYEEMY